MHTLDELGGVAPPAEPSATYELTVLPDLGGPAVAVDINELGEIVGSAWFANDQGVAIGWWNETPDDFESMHAVVWRPIGFATPVG